MRLLLPLSCPVTAVTLMPDPAFKGKVVKKKGGGGTPERRKLPFDSVLVAASLHFCLCRLFMCRLWKWKNSKLLQAEPDFLPQFESKFKRCASAASEVI